MLGCIFYLLVFVQVGGELVSPKAPDAVYSDQRWQKINKMRRQVGHIEALRFSFRQ